MHGALKKCNENDENRLATLAIVAVVAYILSVFEALGF